MPEPATFRQLIRANRRNSLLLAAAFTAVLVAVTAVFAELLRQWHAPDAPVAAALVPAVLVAAGAGLVGCLLAWFQGGNFCLAVGGARRIDKPADPQLFNVVEELSIGAGVPMPAVYLIDDPAPNAFAVGRDPAHGAVAITEGLRRKLTRAELQAVMAHELAHIRNRDTLFAVMMAVLVGTVVIVCDLFLRHLWWGGRVRTRDNRRGGGNAWVMLILMLAAVVLAILAPILAKLIQLAVSREREYLADISGAELTRDPEALCSALAKIEADPEPSESANRATAHLYFVNPLLRLREGDSTIWSSHPPTADRIRRLRSLVPATAG